MLFVAEYCGRGRLDLIYGTWTLTEQQLSFLESNFEGSDQTAANPPYPAICTQPPGFAYPGETLPFTLPLCALFGSLAVGLRHRAISASRT
jgi:hypothetical protein